MILGAVKSEYEGKNYPAKIAGGSGQSRNDSIIGWMDVRDNGKISAVSCISKDGRDRNSGDESVNFDLGNKAYSGQDYALGKSTCKN